MKKELRIIGLYEYNDVYQVIDTTDHTVNFLFQGSKEECKKYKRKNK
jgi:hypothetical protein